MVTKVLVGVDGSDASKRAFHVALDLVKTHRGELHVVSCIEDQPQYAEMLMDEVDERREQEETQLRAVQDQLVKSEGRRAPTRHARHHFELVEEPLARTALGESVKVASTSSPATRSRSSSGWRVSTRPTASCSDRSVTRTSYVVCPAARGRRSRTTP
jgi:hypothetical protein